MHLSPLQHAVMVAAVPVPSHCIAAWWIAIAVLYDPSAVVHVHHVDIYGFFRVLEHVCAPMFMSFSGQ